MSRIALAVRPAATLFALLLTAAPASAQRALEVSVGASGARTDHRLLDHAAGPGLRVALPVSDGRFTLRAGIEALRGEQGRMGSTCVGLVPPGADCAPRPIRDETRLRTAHAGLGLRLLRGPRLTAGVTGDVRFGRVDARSRYTHDDGSAGSLDAGKSLFGPELGAELDWAPLRRLPLALVAGAAVGSLEPRTDAGVVDGYTPFEGSFDVRRAYLGLGWVGRWR